MISAGNDNFLHPDTLYHLIRLNIYFFFSLLLFFSPFYVCLFTKRTQEYYVQKKNKLFVDIYLYTWLSPHHDKL